jgi:hypothetical protein
VLGLFWWVDDWDGVFGHEGTKIFLKACVVAGNACPHFKTLVRFKMVSSVEAHHWRCTLENGIGLRPNVDAS